MSRSASQFGSVSSGAITQTVGNGQTTVFGGSGLNPSEMTEVWVYLVELFDRAVGDLGGSPTDLQVRTKMESYLRPVTGFVTLWQYLSK